MPSDYDRRQVLTTYLDALRRRAGAARAVLRRGARDQVELRSPRSADRRWRRRASAGSDVQDRGVRHRSAQMTSDYDRAEILLAFAPACRRRRAGRRSSRPPQRIKSSHDQDRVLAALVKAERSLSASATSTIAIARAHDLRRDAAAEVHGVVHGERLQPEHRADRERQPAGQPHPHERRRQHQQRANRPSDPAQPRARAARRGPDRPPPSTAEYIPYGNIPNDAIVSTGSSAPHYLQWGVPNIGRLRYLEAVPPAGARPRGTLRAAARAFRSTRGCGRGSSALAETGWHVIAPQLRGFDGGAGDPPATSMDDYAGDVIDLLDALHVKQAVIGGLSMGGYVAFALLRLAARYVQGLILADTRSQADTPEGRRRARRTAAAGAGQGAAGGRRRDDPEAARRNDAARRRPAVVERVRALMLANSTEAIAGAIRALMTRPDSTPLLAVDPRADADPRRRRRRPDAAGRVARRCTARIGGSELVRIPRRRTSVEPRAARAVQRRARARSSAIGYSRRRMLQSFDAIVARADLAPCVLALSRSRCPSAQEVRRVRARAKALDAAARSLRAQRRRLLPRDQVGARQARRLRRAARDRVGRRAAARRAAGVLAERLRRAGPAHGHRSLSDSGHARPSTRRRASARFPAPSNG